MLFYTSSLARGSERKPAGGSGPNLENDIEEKRARKNDSEDSKEFSGTFGGSRKAEPDGLLRIKRKSLILAQDERWRRA